jgi:hypothetical protein
MTTTGKNRIMIYGPKNDGTDIVEFRTAAGEALAISRSVNSPPLPQRKDIPSKANGGLPSGFTPAYCRLWQCSLGNNPAAPVHRRSPLAYSGGP